MIRLLIPMVLLITGCAHRPITDDRVSNDYNPALKAVDYNHDIKQCRYDASKAGLSGYSGSGSAFDSMMAVEASKISLVNECMDLKGWHLK